jgi:hypothetical protein
MASGIRGFAANAAQLRAERYRVKATSLRELAAAEPVGLLRERLTELAAQYDELATRLALSPLGG